MASSTPQSLTLLPGALEPLAGRLAVLELSADKAELEGVAQAVSAHLSRSLRRLRLRVGASGLLVCPAAFFVGAVSDTCKLPAGLCALPSRPQAAHS